MTGQERVGRSTVLIGRCRVERAEVDSLRSAGSGEAVATKAATTELAAVPDISLGEIAAFVALLQCGSFTEAAKRLYLSQPGLSARISRLERALGVVLVDRSTRDLTLTRSGAAFAATAHSVLRLLTPAAQTKAGAQGGQSPVTRSRDQQPAKHRAAQG